MKKKTKPLFLHPTGYLYIGEMGLQVPAAATQRHPVGHPVYPRRERQVINYVRYYLYEDEVCAYVVESWPPQPGLRIYRCGLPALRSNYQTECPSWIAPAPAPEKQLSLWGS